VVRRGQAEGTRVPTEAWYASSRVRVLIFARLFLEEEREGGQFRDGEVNRGEDAEIVREREETKRVTYKSVVGCARRDAYEGGEGKSDGLQHRGHHGARGSVLRAIPPAGHRQRCCHR